MMTEIELLDLVSEWEDTLRYYVGLDVGEILSVEVSPHARQWLGRCRYIEMDSGKLCHLQFAKALLSLPKTYIVNTVVHEMCHAVNGTRGHDQAWKRACQDVMDFYPELHLDIYATREEAKAFRKALPPHVVYRATCQGCGHVYTAYKKTRFVKACLAGDTQHYHCACGSDKFDIEVGRE